MNAVEHIVECYFRYCLRCFTMSDVKIKGGNNRQFDLLAISLIDGKSYHVESSVTHGLGWSPTVEKLRKIFLKKFYGKPPKKDGENTDYARGKDYYTNIKDAYREVGLTPSKVKKVFVTWQVDEIDGLEKFLRAFKNSHSTVEVWSLRDRLLPALEESIGTSNFDDEVLRTLSLVKQKEIQTKK